MSQKGEYALLFVVVLFAIFSLIGYVQSMNSLMTTNIIHQEDIDGSRVYAASFIISSIISYIILKRNSAVI